MRKGRSNWRRLVVSVLVFVTMLSLMAVPAFAAANELPTFKKTEVIYDLAELLSNKEEKRLTEGIKEIRQACDINLVVVTQDSFKGSKESMLSYAQKAYQNACRAGIGIDSVVVVVSKFDNLEFIYVGDSLKRYFSEEDIESALEKYKVRRDIGEYERGLEEALEDLIEKMGVSSDSFFGDSFNEVFKGLVIKCVLIVIGLPIGIFMIKFLFAFIKEERRYRKSHK